MKITLEDLDSLLKLFGKKAYEAGSCEPNSTENEILETCRRLFQVNEKVIVLQNINGCFCTRYPSRIFIPEFDKSCPCKRKNYSRNQLGKPLHQTCSMSTYVRFIARSHLQKLNENIYDEVKNEKKMRKTVSMAKYARCRQRFIVPVMLFRGKYICRSATLSIMKETYGRKVVDCAYDYLTSGPSTSEDASNDKPESGEDHDVEEESDEPPPFSYEEVIKCDIELLKIFRVSTIVDFMMEQGKVKYFMTVSSSEKADPANHYKDYNILSLPYPGCEFFTSFRDNDYSATGLHFNWNQSYIDAELNISPDHPAQQMNIQWEKYKEWDLVLMTQNYLKAILRSLRTSKYGMLIHCISGWDRTPLFISLIRLSLWADGAIHDDLNPLQIIYLTVAYDWYMFGHQLPDRIRRGEDIMLFCFHMLKYIMDDDFSFISDLRTPSTSSNPSETTSPQRAPHSSDCDVLADMHNPFSPTHIHTPPIRVPTPNKKRQRNDSGSPTGSWCIVTGTGSLDTSENCTPECNAKFNFEPGWEESILKGRQERLRSVREIFIKAYAQAIGLKFKDDNPITISSFIGAVASQLFHA